MEPSQEVAAQEWVENMVQLVPALDSEEGRRDLWQDATLAARA